jgi:hypothetical protein
MGKWVMKDAEANCLYTDAMLKCDKTPTGSPAPDDQKNVLTAAIAHRTRTCGHGEPQRICAILVQNLQQSSNVAGHQA